MPISPTAGTSDTAKVIATCPPCAEQNARNPLHSFFKIMFMALASCK